MKKLIFVTSKFPFGSGETFIENEIEYLADEFDKIYIFAAEAHSAEPERPVPENVSVLAANPKPVSKKDYIPCLLKPAVIKEIFKNCLSKGAFQKIAACCWFSVSVRKQTKRLNDFIRLCGISETDDITVYSYWLSTIGMCALKINEKLKKIGVKTKIVSRCHSFDLYAERSYSNYLPFQHLLISKFDNIFPCSKNGEEYLKSLYPQYSTKIKVSYLGVKDRFTSALPKKENVFNIVSCSNIIPVKRVDLIVRALSTISDKQILWTHLGDGEEFEQTKNFAEKELPANIKYDFKGRIPNSEIYDFYNRNNINLFINVSEIEGLPVSIMEAVSFGVPVMATDVGGTGEIVKDGVNGFLLKKDFEIKTLTDFIIKFTEMEEPEYTAFCENARKVFLENFEAEKNYSDFIDEILSENNNQFSGTPVLGQ